MKFTLVLGLASVFHLRFLSKKNDDKEENYEEEAGENHYINGISEVKINRTTKGISRGAYVPIESCISKNTIGSQYAK